MSKKYKNYSITLLMADGKEHIIPFAVPMGEDGEKGDPGKSAYEIAVEYGFNGSEAEWLDSLKYGKDGESAYQIAVEYGFQGTEKEWLASLKGEKGERGEQGLKGADGANGQNGADGKDGANGKDGVPATHSWNGTVLTVSSASGTSSANLKGEQGVQGPRGEQGVQGKSAYQVALDNGFTGSETEWIASLKGEDGADGNDGVSITEVKQIQTSNLDGGANVVRVTLSNGTQSQFQFKNGKKGSDGVDGKDYVLTEADKQEIVTEASKQIDTSKFATLSGYNEFSNSIVAPEFTTTINDDYKYAIYYPNHIYYVDDSEGMGYSSELIFPTSEVGTIATREWVQANASGMKLEYLGDFAVETPSIDPNMYRGFMFQIGIDYDYGMAFDIVKSGMVFFEDLSWYGYGGGVYFPFTTSDLHRLGVFVDPYGNGSNADEKIVLQLAPNMDWTAYEIASNPFIGATHENGQRVFVKIYGIKG